MKANDALFRLLHDYKINFSYLSSKNEMFSRDFNSRTNSLIFRIKDNLSIDYTSHDEIKENDLKKLNQLVSDYLKFDKDEFDKRYIIFLSWNIHNIKPVIKKVGDKKKFQSLLEYQPGVFVSLPKTKKIFDLFEKHSECKERISAALMMTYLKNYNHASEYFTTLLKKYLKSVGFSKDLNLYFDVNKAGCYGWGKSFSHCQKSFLRKLDFFQVRSSYAGTKYFEDAWYFWMTSKANPSSKMVLEDLSCRYFYACTDFEKVLILSRLTVKINHSGNDFESIYNKYLRDLFPIDPNIPSAWLPKKAECDIKMIKQLVDASNIFQRTFATKPSLMSCVCRDGEIKVYCYQEEIQT